MTDQKILPLHLSNLPEDFPQLDASSRIHTDVQAINSTTSKKTQCIKSGDSDTSYKSMQDVNDPSGLNRSTTSRMGRRDLWRLANERLKRKLNAQKLWDSTRKRLNSLFDQSVSTNETSNDFQGLAIKQCLLLIVAYLIFGVISYSFIYEQMPISTSLYFTVVTFTTVGYGDVTPSTVGGKIFTCFFATIGVSFIGLALGLLVSNAMNMEEKIIYKLRQAADKIHIENYTGNLHHDFDGEVEHCSGMTFEYLTSNQEDLSSIMKEKSRKRFWKEFLRLCLVRFLPIFLLLFMATMLFMWTEDWKWYDAYYYLIVTSTTVGYGDVVPVNSETKLYAAIFIIVAAGATADMMGRIAHLVISRRRIDYLYQLESRKFHLKELMEMDADGDGRVSALEYIQYMLLALEKVDKKLLSHLHKEFHKLDLNDCGSVAIDDIKLLNEEHRSVSLMTINCV